jgi:serine/threonine protein kinase
VATQRLTRKTTMRETELITKDSFKFIKKLGEGAYAKVYLVKKKDTDKLYGLK